MIDQYFIKIRTLSETYTGNGLFVEYFDTLLRENNNDAKDLLCIADEIYINSDKEKYFGLLEYGYFRHLNSNERILAFLICIEVVRMRVAASLITLCEPYTEEQFLFQRTTLQECIRKKRNNCKDNELIDMQAIQEVDNSEIVKVTTFGYARIISFLKPSIPW